MNPLRQIYEDAPDVIVVPEGFRHRRIELIIWPLNDEPSTPPTTPPYQKCIVAEIVMPSREDRHDR